MSIKTKQQFLELYQKEQVIFLTEKPTFTAMMQCISDPMTADPRVAVYFTAIQELLTKRTEWPEEFGMLKYNKLMQEMSTNHPRIQLKDEE